MLRPRLYHLDSKRKHTSNGFDDKFSPSASLEGGGRLVSVFSMLGTQLSFSWSNDGNATYKTHTMSYFIPQQYHDSDNVFTPLLSTESEVSGE